MSAFKDHFFQTRDGLRLYARDYSGPDNSAPVVLCLHGLTRNSRDFQDLAPALTEDLIVNLSDSNVVFELMFKAHHHF